MQIALVALGFILEASSESKALSSDVNWTNLLLCICKEFPNILFRRTDKFIQNFRAIDDLRLLRVEHFPDLPSHESLASAGWTKENDTCGSSSVQPLALREAYHRPLTC